MKNPVVGPALESPVKLAILHVIRKSGVVFAVILAVTGTTNSDNIVFDKAAPPGYAEKLVKPVVTDQVPTPPVVVPKPKVTPVLPAP